MRIVNCSNRARIAAAIAALFVVVSSSVMAHSYKLGNIAVGHIWAAPPGPDGGIAVYGPFLNQGDKPIQLEGATTPIAERVDLRRPDKSPEDWEEPIKLEPGEPFALAPWREHLWITEPSEEIVEGDVFDLTLDFGAAGSLTVKVEVEPEGGH